MDGTCILIPNQENSEFEKTIALTNPDTQLATIEKDTNTIDTDGDSEFIVDDGWGTLSMVAYETAMLKTPTVDLSNNCTNGHQIQTAPRTHVTPNL